METAKALRVTINSCVKKGERHPLIIGALFVIVAVALLPTMLFASTGDVTWATSTNTLPAAFNDATSVINGNKVYIMGQYGNSGSILTPYIGTVANNAEITWTVSLNSMPAGGDYPTADVYGNKIYYMGAANYTDNSQDTWGSDQDILYIGTIGNGGDVTWATGSNPLPWDFADSSSVVYGNKIYVMGGGSCNGCHTNHVAIGTIGNDGDVTWATSTNVLPAVSGFATGVLYQNRIYVMGGNNGSSNLNTVYIGTIGNDGEVTWTTSAHTLPAVSSFATAVVNGNMIYVMGGYGAGNFVDTNAVFIGTIGNDYDVTWATSSSTVPQALDSANSEPYNGKIYFLGGENGNGNSNSVFIGSIEGLISPPTLTTSAATSISASSVTLNGSITSTGGADATQSGFAYGTDATLGNIIATTTLGGQSGTASFSQTISGLSANTTYYFRAYAGNSAGTSTGSILSATTLAAASPSPASTVSISSGGGSVSPQMLATLLAPGPATTAYLNSLHINVSECPLGFTCTLNSQAMTPSVAQLPHANDSANALAPFSLDLWLNSTGTDVERLQSYLNTHGYTLATTGPGSPGNETNYFGSKTKTALAKFQKTHGIPGTGYFGPLTRKAVGE
jgi:hypothetical protein